MTREQRERILSQLPFFNSMGTGPCTLVPRGLKSGPNRTTAFSSNRSTRPSSLAMFCLHLTTNALCTSPGLTFTLGNPVRFSLMETLITRPMRATWAGFFVIPIHIAILPPVLSAITILLCLNNILPLKNLVSLMQRLCLWASITEDKRLLSRMARLGFKETPLLERVIILKSEKGNVMLYCDLLNDKSFLRCLSAGDHSGDRPVTSIKVHEISIKEGDPMDLVQSLSLS